MIDNTATNLSQQITLEIKQYTTELVNVGEAYDYSQYKLVRRITLFESHTYPTGKFDSQGNYKFWYDNITPLILDEVKNIDFDSRNVHTESDRQKDELPLLITNLSLKKFLRENGQDDEFNQSVEEGSGWGNVVWKRVKKSYERADLKNFYVINQTARTLKESPVIERHPMSASDLRAKMGVWDEDNLKATLESCKSNSFKSQVQTQAEDSTVPYYEIFERNGEVCLADLKKIHNEDAADGDENKFVFAKVIGAGKAQGATTTPQIQYILFAEELKGKDNEDIYEEFHRGPYKGKWFREGIYELLFDLQVRLNQIGNQLAQGLELASKTILYSKDKLIVQNILSDMKNGDIIRADGLAQVGLEMHAYASLINEWNQIKQHMRDLANSSTIVRGQEPTQMPAQEAALLNANSNKAYDFVRQKFAIPFTNIFCNWIIPDLIKDLTAKEILRLTGDAAMLDRLYDLIVSDWYVTNLIAIGPHSPEIGDMLKAQQLESLKKRPQLLMEGLKAVFKDFKPSVSVVITGENSTLPQDLQTLYQFIGLEQDPVRRSAMIEMAMSKKGLDVASLPKSPPTPMQPGPDGKIAQVAPPNAA